MTIPSLADAGIFIAGAAFAGKILIPLFKNGKSNGNGNGSTLLTVTEAEWRGEMRSLILVQTTTLATLSDNISKLTTVVVEIERRTRDSEIAIRKILGHHL